MSSPSTSRRRRREDDDDSESDHSQHDDSTVGSKRRRLDGSESETEGDESPDGPILPDNYRRSPKGKERARDVESHSQQEHHPGSIVRVTLKDFVTYTHAEFFPGPNLNMVIGPNGTGKSTLVCAICIGLGWSTSHLGRAKDISEFVKHGRKQAEIEIELKADPLRHRENPVITHKINRDGSSKSGQSKSVWLINGKKSTHKAAQDLARSFSIQVDNLCQFLPQDRVVEFAALSPVDLLVHTQRAAAPEHVSEWHEQLKAMGKDHKQKQTEKQGLIETLKNMEDRQRSQQDEVNRLRERTTLQARLALLEKMRPFAEYNQLKTEHKEAKASRKEAQKELRALERRIQPNMDAVEKKKSYQEQVAKVSAARRRLLTRCEINADSKMKDYEKTKSDIDECNKLLDAEKTSVKQAKRTIINCEREIRNTNIALDNPPAPYDPAQFNEKNRDLTLRIRKIDDDINDINEEKRGLTQQLQQRERIIEQEENLKRNLQSQAGRQTNKLHRLSPDTVTAWKWIQENRGLFESEVFGPALIECSLKDATHADQVESVLGKPELLSFTVTSQRDFRTLDEHLYRKLKLTDILIRASLHPLESFHAPHSDEELKRFGLQSWLVDLIDGPPAVLAMLCDNKNIHQTGFTAGELSKPQYEALQRSSMGSWVTRTHIYRVTRRREYSGHVSTQVQNVKKAEFLADAPVDTHQEADINSRIATAKGEIAKIKEETGGVLRRYNALRAEQTQLGKDRDDLQAEKDDKQRQHTAFNGLATKLQSQQKKLDDAKEKVRQQGKRKMEIAQQMEDLYLKKGQQALDYASTVDSLRDLHKKVLEAEISRIEAESDVEQLENRNREDERLVQEKRGDVDRHHAAERQAHERGKALQQRCLAARDDFNDEEQAYHDENQDTWDKDQLETDIQSAQAALESLLGGNENVILDFERRAQKIDEKRVQLGKLRDSLEALGNTIHDIRGKWEPELELIVAQISEAFAENFARIDSAGEVAIHRDDDFEQWAIQIKVKFRENEQLSVLDSHRQSGGERAVSTIFYLMALQSLARAPFRVVDEINQGMDPRNERLVHSRMVEIACAEHTSQYFLITPKLLNNLVYHRNMKVHCIASGEYMPADHRELDFQALASRALAVRAAAH